MHIENEVDEVIKNADVGAEAFSPQLLNKLQNEAPKGSIIEKSAQHAQLKQKSLVYPCPPLDDAISTN